MFERLQRRARQAIRERMRRVAAATSGSAATGDRTPIAYDPPLVPPLSLMRTEGIDVLEEWFRWGEEWSVLLRTSGGLRGRSDVLEIGCGLGLGSADLIPDCGPGLRIERWVLRTSSFCGRTEAAGLARFGILSAPGD